MCTSPSGPPLGRDAGPGAGAPIRYRHGGQAGPALRHTLHLKLPPVVTEHLAQGHARYRWDCPLCVRIAELAARAQATD